MPFWKREKKPVTRFVPHGGGLMHFTLDDQFLTFWSASKGTFTVSRFDIETVTVEGGSFHKTLKLIGRGTLLAEVREMTAWTADESQKWILTWLREQREAVQPPQH